MHQPKFQVGDLVSDLAYGCGYIEQAFADGMCNVRLVNRNNLHQVWEGYLQLLERKSIRSVKEER